MEIKKISHLMVEYTKTIHNVRPCWTIAEQYVQNTEMKIQKFNRGESYIDRERESAA